eukprot:CAMPEP_0170559854 /NCGR_PEP_ID=MMETSP0211-20121228/45433_1 /TAXON_ID=311385 /ORGANISM="Pseudokeronopsis sp., Strain OXSARD2" /LENGTH=79 /DNA_ID=CAMNT_0010873401 /DNA_START=905 /DNA_END=1141 /DNA_ORIENTATION=-
MTQKQIRNFTQGITGLDDTKKRTHFLMERVSQNRISKLKEAEQKLHDSIRKSPRGSIEQIERSQKKQRYQSRGMEIIDN